MVPMDHNLKIFYAIVTLVAIAMMDIFVCFQRTAQMLTHDVAVFKHRLPLHINLFVAMLIDMATSCGLNQHLRGVAMLAPAGVMDITPPFRIMRIEACLNGASKFLCTTSGSTSKRRAMALPPKIMFGAKALGSCKSFTVF